MLDDSIQSMGGKARDKALSAKQKREIAIKAAEARWPKRATHKGTFQEEFGIDVDCYVLDDEDRTAVLSQTGVGRAIGLSSRANAVPRLLESKAMMDVPGGAQLRAKLSQPLKFQWGTGGAHEPPPSIIHGFDATLLIELCQAIIRAEQNLTERQRHIAKQAHIILSASAKSGIKGLVYALAGYSPEAEEVIAAFKMYVLEEAKKYEKEFPNELYAEWYRLYEIPILPRGKSWHFKHLTVKHIYYPLAQSSGKVLQLLRAIRARGGDRNKKLFQFLSEIGARALRIQLGRVLEMAESSPDKATYERKTIERFGGQPELPLKFASPD